MISCISMINGGYKMEGSSKMFGEESIGKLLFKFSLPIIISLLVSELYNMVDTLFVGRYVGGDAIGGLVLVFPIQRIIIALSIMFGIGTSTSFSRANGEKDFDKSRKVLSNGFSLNVVVMVALTILVSIFGRSILKMLGASEQLLPYAQDYLKIVILGSTFLSLTTFTSHVMISLGNSKISIISTSIGAILNIIIDYILVVRMGMGVKGAAIATTGSQIVGFLYAYTHLKRVRKEYDIKGLSLDKKIIVPLILVGISSFIIEAEDGIVMAFINNLLSKAEGDSAIIVLGVVTKVYMFLFVTMFGIASAMQPIAAYNAGAKNYKRLKEVVIRTVIYATLTTGILWLICMTFTENLMAIFVRDPVIIEKSAAAFRIMIAIIPLISVYYVSIFYFQAIGAARYSVTISILRQLIVMIPLAIFLVKVMNMGAMGVWLSYPISDIISALVSTILLVRESKKLDEKIEDKEAERLNMEKGQ